MALEQWKQMRRTERWALTWAVFFGLVGMIGGGVFAFWAHLVGYPPTSTVTLLGVGLVSALLGGILGGTAGTVVTSMRHADTRSVDRPTETGHTGGMLLRRWPKLQRPVRWASICAAIGIVLGVASGMVSNVFFFPLSVWEIVTEIAFQFAIVGALFGLVSGASANAIQRTRG